MTMIPSLYLTSLLRTKDILIEYLKNHLRHCPKHELRTNHLTTSLNIDVSKSCASFLDIRQTLKTNVSQKVLEDLFDLFSKYRVKSTQKNIFIAAMPLLYHSEIKSIVIKNAKDCYLRWHQPNWDGITLEPTIKLLLGYGCANIIELDILSAKFKKMNIHLFILCFGAMPNLKFLSFSLFEVLQSNAGFVVKSIGVHCSNLVYLYIRDWDATMIGIQQLTFRDYPRNQIRSNCCETVQYMSIFKNIPNQHIDFQLKKEMVAIILNNFNRLKSLRSYDSTAVSILCEDENRSFENMIRIYCNPAPYFFSMEMLSKACPNVTEFSLLVSRTDIVQNLHLFQKLNTIDAHSYSTHFETYLQSPAGCNLTTLYFHGHEQTDNVDLFLVGKACPNLEKLVLRNIRFHLNGHYEKPILQNLKTLYLLYDEFLGFFFDYNILTWLQTTNLEELYLGYHIDIPHPQPLLTFSKLKHFCLENILSVVTLEFIECLINSSPELETIGSFDITHPVSLARVNHLMAGIQSSNLKVQLLIQNETYPYISGHPTYFKVSERVFNNASLYAFQKCV